MCIKKRYNDDLPERETKDKDKKCDYEYPYFDGKKLCYKYKDCINEGTVCKHKYVPDIIKEKKAINDCNSKDNILSEECKKYTSFNIKNFSDLYEDQKELYKNKLKTKISGPRVFILSVKRKYDDTF